MGDYLNGVLFSLIPLMNILFILFTIRKYINDNKSFQDFLNKRL
jgi:hypothetical protein